MFETWTVNQRLWSISALFLLPLVWLLYNVVGDDFAAIDRANSELAGSAIMTDAREAAAAVLSGANAGASLDRLDQAVKQQAAALGPDVEKLAAQTIAAGRKIKPGDPTDAFVESAAPLMAKIGDATGVTIDPSLDVHYLADAVAVRELRLLDRVGALGALAIDVGEHGIGASDRTDMETMRSTIGEIGDSFIADLDQAIAHNDDGSLKASLGPITDQVKKGIADFDAVADQFLQGRINGAMVDQMKAARDPVVKALGASWSGSHAAMNQLIEARVSKLRRGLWVSGGLSLVLVVAAFVFMALVQRKITRGLDAVGSTVQKVHHTGDLTVRARVQGHDELAALAVGLNELLERIEKAQGESAAAQARATDAERDRLAAVAKTADSFELAVEEIIAGLASGVTELQASAGTLASLAEQTSLKAESIADGANAAADVTRESAEATSRLDASFGEMDRRIHESERGAKRAVEEAADAAETIRQLADQAARIGEVVQLINGIAAQTNLLALNATIEAARAGEAGRGFAVVATEVKNLAGQAASATEDISAGVSAIQAAVTKAVAVIGRVGSSIREIDEISGFVGRAAQEQRNVLSTVTDGVQRTSHAVRGIAADTMQARDAARETDHAAQALSATSDLLSEQSVMLQTAVRNVVDALRGGPEAS